MTNRPLDSDGNPPLPGQLDIDDVLEQETDEERVHRKSREKLDQPMTAAQIVADRLRGKTA